MNNTLEPEENWVVFFFYDGEVVPECVFDMFDVIEEEVDLTGGGSYVDLVSFLGSVAVGVFSLGLGIFSNS